MTQQTIKSHEFTNKSRVELLFDEGNYATIGKVQSYLVLFLEYNKGPYYEGQENDHHFMVCNGVHFALTNFIDAIKCFDLYCKMYNPEQTDEKFDDVQRKVKNLSWMKLEDIKSFHDTLFQKGVVGELPGAQIEYQSICSTGSIENQFGVGKTDISLHRPGSKYQWVDLLNIGYSNPTENQMMDAQTVPGLQPHHSDIYRR